MKVWIPHIAGASGADVFTTLLVRGLRGLGLQVATTVYPHRYQYWPAAHRNVAPPFRPDVIVANSQFAFAFDSQDAPLVAVEHHSVFDPSFAPYRSLSQRLYHEGLVRRFVNASYRSASAVVAVSHYTAGVVASQFPGIDPIVIHNGIDTSTFRPAQVARESQGKKVALFVGNLSRRKGADLLPAIADRLGPDFALHVTSGMRTGKGPAHPGIVTLGYLEEADLVSAYQSADVVISPSRLEGFGLSVAEAMACGTPVVVTRGSAFPELVRDFLDGRLCEVDDVDDFAAAIQWCTATDARSRELGHNARARICDSFTIERMAASYRELFESVTSR